MRLTVSSTAMMKPLLQTRQHLSRVTGLLEFSPEQNNRNAGRAKLLQYARPGQQYARLQTVQWQELFQVDNIKHMRSAAVFGFEFDGTSTWYQVWNSTSDSYCWLLHSDDMNYESFAILVMDALVSLLPNWDGTLHPSPDSQGQAKGLARPKYETIDARQIHNILISDASTSAAGQLWFLVTVNSTRRQRETGTESVSTQSGWISPGN